MIFLRVAVLVSGGGTNLQALLDAKNSGKMPDTEIVRVISSREDAGALVRAAKAGIGCETVARSRFKNSAEFSMALFERICSADPDLIVLAGFLCILPAEIVGKFKNKIMNVHPSLIPAFSGEGFYGLKVHEAALARGVKMTGATVHFVSDEVDGGPIILQKAVPVMQGDTPETLQRRVMEQAEWEILPKAVNLFCSGRLFVDGHNVNILEEMK